jgi:hypothetical protein
MNRGFDWWLGLILAVFGGAMFQLGRILGWFEMFTELMLRHSR